MNKDPGIQMVVGGKIEIRPMIDWAFVLRSPSDRRQGKRLTFWSASGEPGRSRRAWCWISDAIRLMCDAVVGGLRVSGIVGVKVNDRVVVITVRTPASAALPRLRPPQRFPSVVCYASKETAAKKSSPHRAKETQGGKRARMFRK